MIPFLKSVARAYMQRYDDLSRFCFLFPNKRSGTFFLKYLQEEAGGRVLLAPEIKAISQFVSDVSRRVPASRLDQIFLLYQCYNEEMGVNADDDTDGTAFDSFRTWGETVLSDFSEIDMYLCDPDEVFKNVKDYRSIASTFLTEEQKKVMSEYFGRVDQSDPKEFWKHFDDAENNSEAKNKFLLLWRILAPLYRRFTWRLAEQDLATTGGMYREALRCIHEQGNGALPYAKVVAVGFNALTTVEHAIFGAMNRLGSPLEGDTFIDFFWDATGPVFNGDKNSASKFIKADIKSFPCPEWALPTLRMSDTDRMPPEINVVKSPSNAAQAKIAGQLLGEMYGKSGGESFRDAKVAVVLADENLLLPMLYSLPAEVGDVNLTMGYPLRLTAVVPFVSLLRRTLATMRQGTHGVTVYVPDLKLLLSHPFSQVLFGSVAVSRLTGYAERHHLVSLPLEELRQYLPQAADIFEAFDRNGGPRDTIKFIDDVLQKVSDAISASKGAMIKKSLETDHIQVYRDALMRIDDLMADYPVAMRPVTVLRLVDRLIQAEGVHFEGEPLEGLQVMGMLETRSLDFERLIVLSANERILPMRARMRSFVPDTLRRAYGMPPSNYAEGIFAYYFFRMLSRAREVTLVYDGRSGAGLRNAGETRYIHQLRQFFAKDTLQEHDWKFNLTGKRKGNPSVEKKEGILGQLHRLEDPESSNCLSASSLISYRSCPVRFFYETVMGINADPEPSEFIDAIESGNILHEVMLNLYLPSERQRVMLSQPVLLTESYLKGLLEGDRIHREVVRSVNKEHYRLSGDELDRELKGSSELVASRIEQQVANIVMHDLALAPVAIHGLEIKDKISVELPSGRRVNFKFAFDRVDEVEIEGKRTLRIIDYKTGKIKLKSTDIDDIVKGGGGGSQSFQLMVYAWLLKQYGLRAGRPVGLPDDVRLEIYDANTIHQGKVKLPQIIKEGTTQTYRPIMTYGEFAEEFEEGLTSLIESIFTEPVFAACEEESRCTYCNLRSLCGR